MRLLIVSGRTLNRAATAIWGRARRWWKMVARSRSARVRTGGGRCRGRSAAGGGRGGRPGSSPAAGCEVSSARRSGRPTRGAAGPSAPGGLARPGPGWAGRRDRVRRWPGRSLRAEGVVPVAVPVVAGQRQCVHLPVTDLDSDVVGAGVQLGVHAQPGAGGGGGDGLHDDLVAGQRPAPPVHRDVGKQPVLHLVPLRRPGREMADGDLQPGLHRQGRQFGFPRAGAVAVGAAGVRGDQQPPGQGVVAAPGCLPPAADRFHREGGGVMVGAHADTQPALPVMSYTP